MHRERERGCTRGFPIVAGSLGNLPEYDVIDEGGSIPIDFQSDGGLKIKGISVNT